MSKSKTDGLRSSIFCGLSLTTTILRHRRGRVSRGGPLSLRNRLEHDQVALGFVEMC